MTAARPGRAEEQEVLPLTLDEARSILVVASGRRNGVKWDIALALGLRQGEVLGLQWDDVDIEAATLRVRRALQQGKWRHGCDHPEECSPRAQNCAMDRALGTVRVRYTRGGGVVICCPNPTVGGRPIRRVLSTGDQDGRSVAHSGRGVHSTPLVVCQKVGFVWLSMTTPVFGLLMSMVHWSVYLLMGTVHVRPPSLVSIRPRRPRQK